MPLPTLDAPPNTPRFSAYRIVAVSLVIGMVALWAFVLTRKAEPAPDLLDDGSFAVSAQNLCDATMSQLEQLPQAFQSASASDRADVVAQTNTDLGNMLDSMRAIVPAAERRPRDARRVDR